MKADAAIYVVDDDQAVGESLKLLFESVDLETCVSQSASQFARAFTPDRPCCIVLDIRMPEFGGMEILARLRQAGVFSPVIFLTGYGDVETAVRAIKMGAAEYLEKPVNDELLLERVQHWIGIDRSDRINRQKMAADREKLRRLSKREREVLVGVLDGLSNKQMAIRYDLSVKSIEVYRSKMMKKMETGSVAEIIRKIVILSIYDKNKEKINHALPKEDMLYSINISADQYKNKFQDLF